MNIISALFGPPPPEKFASLVMEELTRHRVVPLSFDAAAFAIRIGGPDAKELFFLENFYAVFAKAPRKERHDVVVRAAMQWIQRPAEKPGTFAEARSLLRPAVRSLAYYDMSNLRLEVEGLPDRVTPFQTLGKHLAIGLVLDYPESVRMVLPKDLADWGVSIDEAMQGALSTLSEQSSPSFAQEGGLFRSTWDDAYDATRLLLSHVVTTLPVRGRHVALAPHRNLLLITGSEDAEGLLAMASAAEQMFGEPQPISAWPLILEEGAWRDWNVASDHPAAHAFQLVQLRRLSIDYADQGALLTTVVTQNDEDGPYVAKFSASQHATTGVLTSYATWTDEVDTLLPEVERISFNRVHSRENVEGLGFVKWDEVMRVVPELLEPTDRYPARWRVRQFPSAEQLAQMAKI
jgi:hypothetical protein